ncbi:hypothetical protein [Parasphingorhabdus pacifica]
MADATYDLLVRWANARGWKGIRSTKVTADEVRRAFYEASKGRTDDTQPEAALAACVDILRNRGVLRAMRSTNREKVPLARGFHLTAVASAGSSEVPDMPIWHRELYDLADHWEAANPLRRARYVAVNRWLKSGVDRTRVPIRERCLDVFATFGSPECHPEAEKTLDAKTTAVLFGEEERLMAVLRTYRVPPPLLTETVLEETGGGYQRVGSGDLLLVLENSTTWHSIVKALPEPRKHRVGYVAWGLGASFIRSVQSIAERHRITQVRYFGDLDLSGVRIPAQAAAVAHDRGLPPVVPAPRLYDALLMIGRPSPSREKATIERAEPYLGWLDRAHRASATGLLAAGNRLAQEWVGLRHLTTSTDWHEDLR